VILGAMKTHRSKERVKHLFTHQKSYWFLLIGKFKYWNLTQTYTWIRFVQNSKGFFKDQKNIKITENLTINNKMVLHNTTTWQTHLYNSLQYVLTSVIAHIGHSLNGGHYVSYVNTNDNKWYEYDDTKVSIGITNCILWVCIYRLHMLILMRFQSVNAIYYFTQK
jgi:hypothetical protein